MSPLAKIKKLPSDLQYNAPSNYINRDFGHVANAIQNLENQDFNQKPKPAQITPKSVRFLNQIEATLPNQDPGERKISITSHGLPSNKFLRSRKNSSTDRVSESDFFSQKRLSP